MRSAANRHQLVDTHTVAVQNQQQELKSKVELGSGVFCRAHVPDTTRIYISIGLGFHLEATLEEAHKVIQLKLETLQGQVDKCVDKAARIKANLKFVAQAIRELMELPS
jgi:prefoldin alpha subunit